MKEAFQVHVHQVLPGLNRNAALSGDSNAAGGFGIFFRFLWLDERTGIGVNGQAHSGALGQRMTEARDLAKSLEGVRKTPAYLYEYIRHDSLFKAYPDLKSVKVVFDDLEGERGHYSPKKKEIVVSSMLRNNDELLKDTIVHEIQHAIQHIEGFSGGASPKYWDEQIRSGYDARTKSERAKAAEIERQYHQVKEDPEFFEDASQLVLSRPTVPIEVDNAEWLEYYKSWNELYEKYGDRLKEFINLYDRVLISQTRTNRNAYDLYMDTAGEIEARDVSHCRRMDAEQRKNTRPDIDREDVVFVEGYGLSFYMIPEGTRVDADKYIEERHGLLD